MARIDYRGRVGRRDEEPADPFGASLTALLAREGDIASERVWQEIPRLIAQQWASFSEKQSPLSTMGMIARACETVLKIRLAQSRGGGEEEKTRLEEFQALMADIWGRGEEDGRGGEDRGEADED